ncbi:MAG: methylated-DNA--[protein]-cysteine S-methyltransferase [Chloroflexota bacterium]
MTNEMETAFYASDPAWDGRFVAAVRTTGIFCRPSCRVRKPLRKNVEFLPDAATARAAGYRACLRCHPARGSAVTLRTIETPVGPMLIGATETAIVLCDFAERPMIGAQLASVRRRIGPTAEGSSPLLDRLEAQLSEYFAGIRPTFDLPLDIPGSAFQERVWAELRRIPYGETISYRELAERVDAGAAYRAVGRANGSNRVAVIVPCHRVIAAGGALGGYGGGLAAKRHLLDLEMSTDESGGSRSTETDAPKHPRGRDSRHPSPRSAPDRSPGAGVTLAQRS